MTVAQIWFQRSEPDRQLHPHSVMSDWTKWDIFRSGTGAVRDAGVVDVHSYPACHVESVLSVYASAPEMTVFLITIIDVHYLNWCMLKLTWVFFYTRFLALVCIPCTCYTVNICRQYDGRRSGKAYRLTTQWNMIMMPKWVPVCRIWVLMSMGIVIIYD